MSSAFALARVGMIFGNAAETAGLGVLELAGGGVVPQPPSSDF